jgi:hypothetical protein
MSLISFIKDAGEKLFKKLEPVNTAPATASSGSAPAAAQPNVADLNAKVGEAIQGYVAQQKLGIENLDLKYDGATEKGRSSPTTVRDRERHFAIGQESGPSALGC